MNKIYTSCCISLFVCFASASFACSSDFSCDFGQICVKEPYKSWGTCMGTVNEFGTPTFGAPKSSSVGPKMNSDGCRFMTDCPIGFKCQRSTKACVKK